MKWLKCHYVVRKPITESSNQLRDANQPNGKRLPKKSPPENTQFILHRGTCLLENWICSLAIKRRNLLSTCWLRQISKVWCSEVWCWTEDLSLKKVNDTQAHDLKNTELKNYSGEKITRGCQDMSDKDGGGANPGGMMLSGGRWGQLGIMACFILTITYTRVKMGRTINPRIFFLFIF